MEALIETIKQYDNVIAMGIVIVLVTAIGLYAAGKEHGDKGRRKGPPAHVR